MIEQFKLSDEGLAAVTVYDQIYKQKTTDKLQVYPDEMVVRMVRRRFKSMGVCDVLDAGCGEGRNALFMAAEGLNVTCLDTSNHALALVKKQAHTRNFELNYSQSSVTDLSFDDERFDAVICWRVLYYLPFDEAKLAVAEFYRILRPGGCIYISISNEQYNYHTSKPKSAKEMISGDKGAFMRRYSEEELPLLLDGFVGLEYGMQAQSFLGNPHLVQSFWHVYAKKATNTVSDRVFEAKHACCNT